MKREHAVAGRIRLQKVCEASFHPGALIAKRQRTLWRGQRVRKSFTVLCCLPFKPGKCAALFLGFYDAECLTIDIEKVVRFSKARLHWKFAYGDTAPCRQVHILAGLNQPSSLVEKLVDILPRMGFRAFGHGNNYDYMRSFAVPSLLFGNYLLPTTILTDLVPVSLVQVYSTQDDNENHRAPQWRN